MIVECYFDRTEATEFLRRGVREEVARRDVLHPVARREEVHPVAVTPTYTVPCEEVAPEVPRVWNKPRINRWTRNQAMRDYLSGKEIEC